MAEEIKEKFNRIYKEQFVPFLQPLEDERLAVNKKVQPLKNMMGIFALLCLVTFFNNAIIFSDYISIISFLGLFICTGISGGYTRKWNIEIKRKITSKLLPLFGNYHFSQNKNLITLDEIKVSGLFKRADKKVDDDVIIGYYNGCNIVINECNICNSKEKYGDYFKGIIVKASMKKNFKGLTVLGSPYTLAPVSGTEIVELESIEFMKNRKIYSTDQIEARYILTTSFMEKLDRIAVIFNAKVLKGKNNNANLEKGLNNMNLRTSAIFYKGYAYLFVPSISNLFELKLNKTLYDENTYSVIFEQLSAIQDIIDYLNIDKNTGL